MKIIPNIKHDRFTINTIVSFNIYMNTITTMTNVLIHMLDCMKQAVLECGLSQIMKLLKQV